MKGLLVEMIRALRRSLTRLFKDRVHVRLPRSWGGLFRSDYDHRDFSAIGASAGVPACLPPYSLSTTLSILFFCCIGNTATLAGTVCPLLPFMTGPT